MFEFIDWELMIQKDIVLYSIFRKQEVSGPRSNPRPSVFITLPSIPRLNGNEGGRKGGRMEKKGGRKEDEIILISRMLTTTSLGPYHHGMCAVD